MAGTRMELAWQKRVESQGDNEWIDYHRKSDGLFVRFVPESQVALVWNPSTGIWDIIGVAVPADFDMVVTRGPGLGVKV
jgi:hypothetical protein